MNDFEISNSPKEVAYNVRMFIRDHKDELKLLMRSIMPVLSILVLCALYLNYHLGLETVSFMKMNEPNSVDLSATLALAQQVHEHSMRHPLFYLAQVVNIFVAYCFAVVAVSWHRLVLLGRDRYEPMKFFAPKKHEINFVIVWTSLGVLVPLLIGFIGQIDWPTIVLSSFVLPYLMFKFSFYFPAKALDSHLSFKDSFRLTHGYFLKTLLTTIRAYWRVFVIFIGCMFCAGALSGALGVVIFDTPNVSDFLRGAYNQVIAQQFETILNIFFFQPIFTVLGVTILSNYYQHALRRKPVSDV